MRPTRAARCHCRELLDDADISDDPARAAPAARGRAGRLGAEPVIAGTTTGQSLSGDAEQPDHLDGRTASASPSVADLIAAAQMSMFAGARHDMMLPTTPAPAPAPAGRTSSSASSGSARRCRGFAAALRDTALNDSARMVRQTHAGAGCRSRRRRRQRAGGGTADDTAAGATPVATCRSAERRPSRLGRLRAARGILGGAECVDGRSPHRPPPAVCGCRRPTVAAQRTRRVATGDQRMRAVTAASGDRHRRARTGRPGPGRQRGLPRAARRRAAPTGAGRSSLRLSLTLC